MCKGECRCMFENVHPVGYTCQGDSVEELLQRLAVGRAPPQLQQGRCQDHNHLD
jgi:hypothetical protein